MQCLLADKITSYFLWLAKKKDCKFSSWTYVRVSAVQTIPHQMHPRIVGRVIHNAPSRPGARDPSTPPMAPTHGCRYITTTRAAEKKKAHVFVDIVDEEAEQVTSALQGDRAELLDRADDAEPTASSVFDGLLKRAGAADAGLRLDTSKNTQGRGIFIDRDVAKGSILLEIPLDMCISVDYAKGGLRLPQDVPADVPAWPRLTKAIAKDDALPWDILVSLALLDSLSGMGSELFQDWANTALPSSSDMSLPVCLPLSMLDELQDTDLVRKALDQKDRLKELFPGLAVPMDGGDGPTWMEYAFACVRSRAFSLGEDRFAFVPVLDAANHDIEPNADFSYNPSNDTVAFFAMKEIKAGEEVTISYTGRVGYKNKRLMTQYGFVFEQGNPFDTFSLQEDLGVDPGSTSFAVEDVQRALGDGESMVDIFSGKDTYSYASLKSLPIDAGAAEDMPLSPTAPPLSEDQRELLERIQRAVASRIDGWQSSLRDDESMLGHMLSGKCDERLVAVMRYRVQAKKRDVAMSNMVERLLSGEA